VNYYKYLREKSDGADDNEILDKFFCTLGKNPIKSDAIVASLLAEDDRFVRDEQGRWFVNKIKINPPL